jgi:hypothetical protein
LKNTCWCKVIEILWNWWSSGSGVEPGFKIRAGPRVRFKSKCLSRGQGQGRVCIIGKWTAGYYPDFLRTAQHWYILGIETDIAVVLNWYYLKSLIPTRQLLVHGWYRLRSYRSGWLFNTRTSPYAMFQYGVCPTLVCLSGNVKFFKNIKMIAAQSSTTVVTIHRTQSASDF